MIKKVSIIIACFNDPDVVIAVKSAYNQTYSNKEIIVVDDGSSQRTTEAINSIKQYIDILLTQKNKGQSIARNNGIKEATGEYILNLDSDDYFEPEFVEKAVQEFEDDTAIKIVTCKARRFNAKGTIDIFTPRGGYLKDFLFRNSALGSSMFKKSDWVTSGGYEEKLPILGFEDWEFYIQLLKPRGYCYVIPEILFHYQVRKDSTTSKIKDLKHEKYKLIILKHSEVYRDNMEALVNNLINKLEEESNKRKQILNSKENQLGSFLIKPLKALKRLIKLLSP